MQPQLTWKSWRRASLTSSPHCCLVRVTSRPTCLLTTFPSCLRSSYGPVKKTFQVTDPSKRPGRRVSFGLAAEMLWCGYNELLNSAKILFHLNTPHHFIFMELSVICPLIYFYFILRSSWLLLFIILSTCVFRDNLTCKWIYFYFADCLVEQSCVMESKLE